MIQGIYILRFLSFIHTRVKRNRNSNQNFAKRSPLLMFIFYWGLGSVLGLISYISVGSTYAQIEVTVDENM